MFSVRLYTTQAEGHRLSDWRVKSSTKENPPLLKISKLYVKDNIDALGQLRRMAPPPHFTSQSHAPLLRLMAQVIEMDLRGPLALSVPL